MDLFKITSEALDKSRKDSDKHKYQCCIPGCNQIALEHSHIVPKCVLKKHICDSKHKLLQCKIDEIHPMSTGTIGELPLEKITILGIEQAMSMPIFCKQHDNSLFCFYEKNADAIEPFNIKFQILQSLRAIGALKHFAEKDFVQLNIAMEYNDFFIGGAYEEKKMGDEYLMRRYNSTISNLYDSLEKEHYDSFNFICIQLEKVKLAVCDAIIDEEDLIEHCMSNNYDKPFNVLYIHLLPKENYSYLILGYDKKFISKGQMVLLERWIFELSSHPTLKIIYEILCNCSNNWCISPDCDSQILDYLKKNYSIDRINARLRE